MAEAHGDVGGPALEPSQMGALALFGGLQPEALEFLARRAKVRRVGAGHCVYQIAEPGRELFVLLAGTVELRQSGSVPDRLGTYVRSGDCFGEMSLVDLQAREASAYACEPSTLAALTARDLDALYRKDVKAYAMLVLNIARELSRKLRSSL